MYVTAFLTHILLLKELGDEGDGYIIRTVIIQQMIRQPEAFICDSDTQKNEVWLFSPSSWGH